MKSILGLGDLPKRRDDSLPCLAARQAVGGLAAGTPARQRRAFFPLGLRVGNCDAVAGVKSISCIASWWLLSCRPWDWPKSYSGGKTSLTTSLTRQGNETGSP